MHFEIKPSNTVFVGITGSHAYGTSTEESDLDIRGVCCAPLNIKLSTHKSFDQFQGDPELLRTRLIEDPGPSHKACTIPWEDCVIYDVVKACHLMAQCNPNMVELLWIPEDCIIHTNDWKKLVAIRDCFLSTKAQHTYSGYAFAQWKKIASHRNWLLNPIKNKPTREKFGLREQTELGADDRSRIDNAIAGVIRGWGIEDFEMGGAERDVLRDRIHDFMAAQLGCQRGPGELEDSLHHVAGASLGLTEDVLANLGNERRYRAAMKQWGAYNAWKQNRNLVRAELEEKYGFDTKHAMHLIRLLRMGTEILEGKGVLVRRPDFEELLAIRRGAYTYDQLDELAKKEMDNLEMAAKVSLLPKKPDIGKIDRVILNLYDVWGY